MSDEKLLREMGIRVSSRRKELGMTQEQVADAMDVSLQMISNLELGKKAIRPENMVKLCRILLVSADYLLTGHHSKEELNDLASKIAKLSTRQQHALTELVNGILEG